jgi:hypothetical protein
MDPVTAICTGVSLAVRSHPLACLL